MNSNVDSVSMKFDIVKLVVAVGIILSGIFGFYYFSDYSVLVRTIGLLVSAGISVLIALKTDKGRNIWDFFHDSQVEVRKVVWPTREETYKTTLIVILVVVLAAISLWLIDMFLGWSIRTLLGQGG
jgi:preprotein translocase subunit SecE